MSSPATTPPAASLPATGRQVTARRAGPGPVATGLPGPRLVAARLVALGPVGSRLAAPRPSATGLVALGPVGSRLAAPRPSATGLVALGPVGSRLAASRPSATRLATPGPVAARLAAPRQPVARLAATRLAVAPLVAAVTAAVLLLAGCGGRATTHHKPGTSHQEATGSSGTLLPARDEGGHRLRELPAADAPTVRAEARPDSEGGWNVHLTVERFRFTPESTGGAALPGRGHARLLVDGRETSRLYGPWGYVPPGAHTLTVRLHADDHTVWAVAGAPVQATVRLDGTPAATSPPASAPSSPRPADPGRTVTLTITGTTVEPPPSRIELKKGERLTLRVTSDRADTLHVHGYDRELPLPPGTPATLTLTADRTGLFEVETHESGLVLTQLVVR
ncbi:hypothetical protein ACF07V_15050 [Streptomyces sp. NPDC015661]|uniref:hypothetical protein n=1 Tax=Streptomyces sp. NPDC015661 TaxID=3364961 RepID=UPI0036FF5E81